MYNICYDMWEDSGFTRVNAGQHNGRWTAQWTLDLSQDAEETQRWMLNRTADAAHNTTLEAERWYTQLDVGQWTARWIVDGRLDAEQLPWCPRSLALSAMGTLPRPRMMWESYLQVRFNDLWSGNETLPSSKLPGQERTSFGGPK